MHGELLSRSSSVHHQSERKLDDSRLPSPRRSSRQCHYQYGDSMRKSDVVSFSRFRATTSRSSCACEQRGSRSQWWSLPPAVFMQEQESNAYRFGKPAGVFGESNLSSFAMRLPEWVSCDKRNWSDRCTSNNNRGHCHGQREQR